MKVHIVVDYMFLYYRYKSMVDIGKMKKLSVEVPMDDSIVEYGYYEPGYFSGTRALKKFIETQNINNNNSIVVDISTIYYTLKEIEGFRRSAENEGNDVTVSVCFDAPSPERKDADKNYKSNRSPNRLIEDDFSSIDIVRKLLKIAGHNVYLREATEADDLIYSTVNKYKDKFDFTVIYTPDTDLIINVCDNVGVYRYKTRKGYSAVSIHNYNNYCKQEFNCDIRYNSILLYKCTCGDKSDNVIGIRGFGPAKFNSLVNHLDKWQMCDWSKLKDAEEIKRVINNCGFFTDSQKEEALHSLELVVPKVLEDIDEPVSKSTRELREKAYGILNMKSLFV